MTNIVLVGVPGAGKSTLAAALSEQLAMPRRSIDELRGEYAEQFGYSAERAEFLFQTRGAVAFHEYVCRLDAILVRHFLRSGDRQIIDGSGGLVCDQGLSLWRRRTPALWISWNPAPRKNFSAAWPPNAAPTTNSGAHRAASKSTTASPAPSSNSRRPLTCDTTASPTRRRKLLRH